MTGVDEFTMADEPATDDEPASRDALRRQATRWYTWVVAALVLLAGGVLTAPDGGLRLAVSPQSSGVLAVDLGRPPSQTWTAPLPLDPSNQNGWMTRMDVLDGVLVVIATSVGGFSIETGEQLWTADVDASRCLIGDKVACVQDDGTDTTQIVTIDSRGEQQRVSWPGADSAIAVAGDVVVLDRRDGGSIVRLDADGDPRWQVPVPAGSLDGGGLWADLFAVGDHLYLSGATTTALDLDTGEIDRSLSLLYVTATPVGFQRVRILEDGTTTTELLDTDGRVLRTDAVVTPDDDPFSDLTFREGFNSWAVVQDGTDLWRIDPEERPMARLDGVLMTSQWSVWPTTLIGRDPLTGEELWRSPWYPLGVGSGSIVLGSDERGTLAGLDVHTGDTVWNTDDAFDWGFYLVLPDGLVTAGGTEITRFRW